MKRKTIQTAEGIPIYCGHTSVADPRKIKPHPKAFRDHSKGQLELLGDIIEATGWRGAATVSKRSGVCTRGYGRVLAAIGKGWTQIPVDAQAYKNEAAELADAVADTRIQEFSKLDDDKLRDYIIRLKKSDYSLRLTGLDPNVINAILTDYEKGLRLTMINPESGSGEGIRQVILVYDDKRFAEFSAAVEAIQEKQKVESLSELCLNLLRDRK